MVFCTEEKHVYSLKPKLLGQHDSKLEYLPVKDEFRQNKTNLEIL